MTDELVTIEVDGKTLQARKGAMLIEATDEAGIYIPRFCYHKKLSIAANCRMCLVEVEKAPKPLPACATPVMEGMKVQTRSPRSKEAQKATMEFLLINHPLDCPICDQGGECELQDLAMGYGADVSRYTEGKRVVKDKNIGPLIQTDMTRCIHCTRCVRFGEEIAGLRELGATGRSEHMQIGTYVAKTVTSEMSGNVIDLCPVGALTSKPFRYSARAWELRQREGIAPHDSVGSNIYFHVKNGRVKRVVPRGNEGINEVWISDRDRFSYEGLYSDDRLTAPMIKKDGHWHEVEWGTALEFAVAGLKAVVDAHGADQLGALASPTATTEELYLLQKVMRGIGSGNIDHRLRQSDFTDQDKAPLFPWLGQPIADLERVDAVLLIGSYTRKEQPIVNHRLRKAALHGASVMEVNPLDDPFNFPEAEKLIVAPSRMVAALAGIAAALLGKGKDRKYAKLLEGAKPEAVHKAMAEKLKGASKGVVLLGNMATTHPAFSTLRALAGVISELSGATLGYLPDAANSCGAWLAGTLPHRGPGGQPGKSAGMHARSMVEKGLKGYVLLGIEPEMDCNPPGLALRAMRQAQFVVSLTAYRTAFMDEYAHVLLPMAPFAETSGTYVNAAGEWQSFVAATAPSGETRPAWKILRVLGNLFGLQGFEYNSSEEVLSELKAGVDGAKPDNAGRWALPDKLDAIQDNAIELITKVPMYRTDALVRRAKALQQTSEVGDGAIHVGESLADKLKLRDAQIAGLQQDSQKIELPVVIDPKVPAGCVLIHTGHSATAELGAGPGLVLLQGVK
jgi:NADH-quinone oxidoreductase subunit G